MTSASLAQDASGPAAVDIGYNSAASRVTRGAPSILTLGPFNAGKSSLLNRLLVRLGCEQSNSAGDAFETYAHDTPLTRDVRCITCMRDGRPLVNLCDMPGFFDATFGTTFRHQFETAINLVIKHAGPIAKIVYVDKKLCHADSSASDLHMSIDRAHRINLLLSEAGYGDVLELVGTHADLEALPEPLPAGANPKRRQARKMRMQEIQEGNDALLRSFRQLDRVLMANNVSGVAADLNADLRGRFTAVGHNNDDALASKVVAWASTPLSKQIFTSNTLQGVIDACRSDLAKLRTDEENLRLLISSNMQHYARTALHAVMWSKEAYDKKEYFIRFDQSQRTIVVSFRGSHFNVLKKTSATLDDWLRTNTFVTFDEYDAERYPKVLVHSGFLGKFKALKPAVRGELAALLERHPGAPVVFTGHSRGGALATLAAFAFGTLVQDSARVVSLYTFGCPKVGNDEFGTVFNSLPVAANTYRFVFDADIVPHLPDKASERTALVTRMSTVAAYGKLVTAPAVCSAAASTTTTVTTVNTVFGLSFGGFLGTTTTTVAAPLSAIALPALAAGSATFITLYYGYRCAQKVMHAARSDYRHVTYPTMYTTPDNPRHRDIFAIPPGKDQCYDDAGVRASTEYHGMDKYVAAGQQFVTNLDVILRDTQQMHRVLPAKIADAHTRCNALDNAFNQ